VGGWSHANPGRRALIVQILHVPDCPHVDLLSRRLETVLVGRADVSVEDRVIQDEAEAAARGMAGSPTLLIDGVDPFAADGRPPALTCRLYTDETGRVSGAPSVTQLRAALGGLR
jgi:predicted DsbA family dithiol-disulfide isomerase